MKTLIKLISTLALAALAAGAPALRAADQPTTPTPPPAAAPQPRAAQMREHRMKMLDEQLKLTDTQKAQINAIWDKTQQDGQTMRQESAENRRAQRRKFREMMRETHDQVRSVLTPEQQKVFDAMPRPGRPPRPAGDDN